MNNSDFKSDIKGLCEAILKENDSVNRLVKVSLGRIEAFIELFDKDQLPTEAEAEYIREIRKLVDSINMYQWISTKKIETVEEMMKEYEKK